MPMAETKIDGCVGTICLDHIEKAQFAVGRVIGRDHLGARQFQRESGARRGLESRSGVKIWCAGHEIDEIPEGHRDPLG